MSVMEYIVTSLDIIKYYLFIDLPIFMCQQCWVPFNQLNFSSVSLIYCLYLFKLRRSPTNVWYPIGSGTCISNSFKPYMVIATIFGRFTWFSNIWKELLS